VGAERREETASDGVKARIRKMLELGLHKDTPDEEARQVCACVCVCVCVCGVCACVVSEQRQGRTLTADHRTLTADHRTRTPNGIRHSRML
jgi:hypothetical protein